MKVAILGDYKWWVLSDSNTRPLGYEPNCTNALNLNPMRQFFFSFH